MTNHFRIQAVSVATKALEGELRLAFKRFGAAPITKNEPLNFNHSEITHALRDLRQVLRYAGVDISSSLGAD
jgi:hypothetical protein